MAAYVVTVPDCSPGKGLKYLCIGVPRAPSDQTANGLGQHMKDVIRKWGLESKLSGITTDSTNVNPASMMNVFPVWFGCAAHMLHNSCLDVCNKIPEVSDVIERVRTVVRMIRSGPKQAELFKQFEDYAMGTQLEVIMDVRTRWNSTYLMLKRTHELSRAVMTYVRCPISHQFLRTLGI